MKKKTKKQEENRHPEGCCDKTSYTMFCTLCVSCDELMTLFFMIIKCISKGNIYENDMHGL